MQSKQVKVFHGKIRIVNLIVKVFENENATKFHVSTNCRWVVEVALGGDDESTDIYISKKNIDESVDDDTETCIKFFGFQSLTYCYRKNGIDIIAVKDEPEEYSEVVYNAR
ncbi:MAG TPA: hypothetical protein PLP33_25395 [Leptospiraceae bacterium]|nr:hypothetical protein [Leptospiraceae bacterium]